MKIDDFLKKRMLKTNSEEDNNFEDHSYKRIHIIGGNKDFSNNLFHSDMYNKFGNEYKLDFDIENFPFLKKKYIKLHNKFMFYFIMYIELYFFIQNNIYYLAAFSNVEMGLYLILVVMIEMSIKVLRRL